jgi:MFS family permease
MPLYWGSISERYGRRVVYATSLALCTLFAGLAGAASTVELLITMRVMGSFCSCAVTVVGGAVIADIWDVNERGFAMSIYYLGIYAGPAIGPVLGGLLVLNWDWRAVQWFLTSYGAILLILIMLFLPETLQKPAMPPFRTETCPSNIEKPNTPEPRTPGSIHGLYYIFQSVKGCLLNPLRAVSYFRFPAIALVIYLASTSFAAIIITGTSIQSAFSHSPYDFSYLTIGLLYLPMPIGLIPGGLLGGRWADRIMDRGARSTARDTNGAVLVHMPEDRLRNNAWVSVLLLPGALLWYGWSVQHGLIWVIPVGLSHAIARASMEKLIIFRWFPGSSWGLQQVLFSVWLQRC